VLVVLTAKDAVEDRVRGLEAGADDDLVKPFVFAELLARVNALARRRYAAKSPALDRGPRRARRRGGGGRGETARLDPSPPVADAAAPTRTKRAVSTWCRLNRHRPVAEQAKTLGRKIRGHCEYYGITGNSKALAGFHHRVQRIWRKWLNSRSHKARMNWERFNRLLEHRPLPAPVAVHSALSPLRRSVPRSRMR